MTTAKKSFPGLKISLHSYQDAILWTKFKSGDPDAFATIISTHYKDIYNYGMRFTSDCEILKDSMQDIFLLLWKNRQTIGSTNDPKFYLMKALRRHLRHTLAKKRILPFSKEVSFESIAGEDTNRQEQLIEDEQLAAYVCKINKAILKLSPRQQEIIYLRFYAGADMDDIAAVMNIRKQSVYNLLHDALEKLKKSTGNKTGNHFNALPLLLYFV